MAVPDSVGDTRRFFEVCRSQPFHLFVLHFFFSFFFFLFFFGGGGGRGEFLVCVCVCVCVCDIFYKVRSWFADVSQLDCFIPNQLQRAGKNAILSNYKSKLDLQLTEHKTYKSTQS